MQVLCEKIGPETVHNKTLFLMVLKNTDTNKMSQEVSINVCHIIYRAHTSKIIRLLGNLSKLGFYRNSISSGKYENCWILNEINK